MALLAAYSFDEPSGDAVDASGNGFDFGLGGTGTRGTGHTNTAATKSGAGMVPLPAGLLAAVNASANRTIMAWLKGDGTTWYVRANHDDIDSGGWGILSLGGTDIMMRARNAGGLAQSTIPIPSADWYHFAGTYDGTNLRTYLNGELVDTRALTAPLRSDADTLDIMEWSTGDTLVDDLRFYDEALDEATIAALMDTPVTEGPAPVDEITGTLPAALGLGGTLDAPAATVGELTGSLPVVVALTGTLDAPDATVPELSATLPVVLGLGGSLTAPPPAVPGLATSVSVAVALAGVLDAPDATVPSLTGPLAVRITIGGQLSDGSEHDVDLTASLGEQDSPTASLGARRWTATLGSQT